MTDYREYINTRLAAVEDRMKNLEESWKRAETEAAHLHAALDVLDKADAATTERPDRKDGDGWEIADGS